MKTRNEILASWDTDGINEDWFAIDSYDPVDGSTHRLFVGNGDEAAKMMSDYYTQPSMITGGKFYRCALISTAEALAYFNGEDTELDERGFYSITETAGILNVSRQRVHAMIQAGILDGRKVGNTWSIYRYSVESRLRETR